MVYIKKYFWNLEAWCTKMAKIKKKKKHFFSKENKCVIWNPIVIVPFLSQKPCPRAF